MKKAIFVALILMFGFIDSAYSQLEDYFREKSNLVIFSGLVFKQDSKQQGLYYGAYLDYQIFKSDNGKWTISPYGVISRSDAHINSSVTKQFSYGGGLQTGFYEANLSFRHQLFTGFSLGLKWEEELNTTESLKGSGRYVGVQKDLMLNTGLNLNLLKSFALRPELFSRSQLQLTWLIPLRTNKQAVWQSEKGNELLNDTYSWNKGYFEVLAKQNIIKMPINWQQEFYFSPKLVALYSYSAGDSRSFYGLGVELATNRVYRDDFLSLGALYKTSRKMTDNYFIFSLNFNLSALLQKN